MGEYIERKKAIDAIVKAVDTGFAVTAEDLVGILDDLPAADVAPVVHERCEFCRDGKTFIGAMAVGGNDGRFHKINYCLHCGAKMDLEELQ